MESVAVKEIAVDHAGHLLVRPETAGPDFQYVYRAGAGVQWDAKVGAFVAAEPHRWTAVELLPHIMRIVREELGISLTLTAQSRWANLTERQQAALRRALEGGTDAG